jgi:hypothetical protein
MEVKMEMTWMGYPLQVIFDEKQRKVKITSLSNQHPFGPKCEGYCRRDSYFKVEVSADRHDTKPFDKDSRTFLMAQRQIHAKIETHVQRRHER